jgi:hypothetical protein
MVWLVVGVYHCFLLTFLLCQCHCSIISVCAYVSGLCQRSDCVCLASFFCLVIHSAIERIYWRGARRVFLSSLSRGLSDGRLIYQSIFYQSMCLSAGLSACRFVCQHGDTTPRWDTRKGNAKVSWIGYYFGGPREAAADVRVPLVFMRVPGTVGGFIYLHRFYCCPSLYLSVCLYV